MSFKGREKQASEAGKKGGRIARERHPHIGKDTGRQLLEKHGRDYFVAMGKKSAETRAAKKAAAKEAQDAGS